MQKLSFYLKEPKKIGISLLHHFGGWIPDKVYLKALFPLYMGYRLNLKNPQRFAEKLQWLKLYDRQSIYHQMVDKVEAKKYIDDLIGPGYTIPTLGVYNSFEQIDWEALPNEFILKATHDSGSYYIVKDKDVVNKTECKRHLYTYWNKGYYKVFREWQYKGLKSRIIAEPLIASPKQLREYKFFCFNGDPKLYQICLDRDKAMGGSVVQCVNIDGTLLDMTESSYNGRVSNNTDYNPYHKEQMISIAKKLSNGLSFLRVDFFEIEDAFFVGELTFHESSGLCAFSPEKWDYTLGEWLRLPIDK